MRDWNTFAEKVKADNSPNSWTLLPLLFACQATLNVIRTVVLEVLDSNQKSRLLEEASSEPSGQESSHVPQLLQGEAELAYLTHEGLFISDALNEAQQQQQQAAAAQDQSSATGSRIQQGRTEPDSNSGTRESASREQSFMYVSEFLLLLF